jgi:Flp pilus assembly pilin Flp
MPTPPGKTAQGSVPSREAGGPRVRMGSGLPGGDEVLRVYIKARAWWDGLAGDDGATAVEYAIMLALIAMVIIGAVTILGQETNSAFERVEFPN